jgi:hypothetical protein
MRRIPLAVATAGLLAAAAPVFASPGPVDAGRAADTELTVPLADGRTMTIDLRAVLGTQGPLLVVDTVDCTDAACPTRSYSGALPSSALTIASSGATADLQTVLDGLPLTVHWTPAAGPDGTITAGSVLAGPDDGFSGSQYLGSPADVTVRFGSDSCAGHGGVGAGVVADSTSVTGSGETQPLTAFHLPDAATPRCG